LSVTIVGPGSIPGSATASRNNENALYIIDSLVLGATVCAHDASLVRIGSYAPSNEYLAC
ncbi:hypothetical protein BDZ89DRAFT_1078861, partial [Hymenopellis radicata]